MFQNPGNQFIALNVLDEVFKSLELWNPRGKQGRRSGAGRWKFWTGTV